MRGGARATPIFASLHMKPLKLWVHPPLASPCASFLLCPADLHLIAAILFVPRVGVANRRHHKVAAIYVHISLSAVLNIYKLYVHLYNMPCPSVSPPLPLSLPLSLSTPFSAVVFVVT